MIRWALILYVAALVASIMLLRATGRRRPFLVAMLPLYAIDCALNVFPCLQSWRNTMSSEAWKHRDDLRWCWTHYLIDAVFGRDHCRRASENEELHGGFWPALVADWRRSR